MSFERVLIVDEAQANVLFFEMLLKEIGIKDVFTAPTGPEGLRLAETEHPQMIIVAWEMVSMPGTIFVQKAKERRKRKYMPSLIYSKRMGDEDVRLTKEMGFKDVLQMPFDREGVKQAVQAIITRETNLDPTEATIRKLEQYLYESKPSEALKLVSPKLTGKSPFQARALTVVAEVWFRLQKYDKAETFVKQALEVEADYYGAWQMKARILSKLGRHDEAIAILKKASEESPRNLTSLLNLGSAYVDADKPKEAKEVFDKVMALDPDSRGAKDELGKMAFKEGNLSLAAQFLAETESGTEMASYFNNLAISHVAQGRYDEAVSTYKSAISLLADKARLHLLVYNLGLAYKKQGKLQECFHEFCSSYLSDPSFEKAYVSLARVVQEMKEKAIPLDKKLIAEVKEKRALVKNGTSQPSAA